MRFFVLLACTALSALLGACVPVARGSEGAPPLPAHEPQLGPDRYSGWTIPELSERSYGAGELRVEQVLDVTDAFTRTLIAFDSDGLTVYGFMDVPSGEGPFPVVIVNHGYVDPAVYSTLTYTTHYADALARAGYVAIHPNLRGYPPSDEGPNPLRAGFAVDVLNLIAHVREQAGQPGDPLEQADGDSIGVWGHSMGGGITQRVLVVSPDVDAALLYGSMSGDEQANHDRILYFSGGERGNWEEGEAPSAGELLLLSPANYLDRVRAAVSIHHGALDDQVTLEWSEALCARLRELGKRVECYTYADQPHTFIGDGDALFIRRMIRFFDRNLK
jgi:dienelactone hydrolase